MHAKQYSPLSSWNVMVDPALHQGHVIAFLCLMTRMLVAASVSDVVLPGYPA